MKNTFKKEERLCSKKRIDTLFHSGSSFIMYPFRVVYHLDSKDSTALRPPCQTIISVSKRRFKKAVDRNAIKRKIRECFRLQKGDAFIPFLQKHPVTLGLAIQYVGKEILEYQVLSVAMSKVLKKLQDECTTSCLDATDKTNL